MEPQIIDYYNELPHGLHVIDKMNQELEDLQKKYEKLEKAYNELKDLQNLNIRIQFPSIEDRNEKHKQMMDKIKEECNLFIDECPNDLLYDYGFNCISRPLYGGVQPFGTYSDIIHCIESELKRISNNDKWSSLCSDEVVSGLSFFRGREMPHWNKLYNELTKDEIKDILFHHIEDRIYDLVYTNYYTDEDDY